MEAKYNLKTLTIPQTYKYETSMHCPLLIMMSPPPPPNKSLKNTEDIYVNTKQCTEDICCYNKLLLFKFKHTLFDGIFST